MMTCPRNCGTDVREHNSSDRFGDGCDTDASLAAWFRLRGVTEREIPALVEEFRGKTEDEMDEMYAELHGPIA